MPPTSPAGTAPFALSVLDNAHTGVGQTAAETFEEIIALAQLAERRGYRRFWMSEVDEIMLVVMGHSRRTQARTVELLADHYALPGA